MSRNDVSRDSWKLLREKVGMFALRFPFLPFSFVSIFLCTETVGRGRGETEWNFVTFVVETNGDKSVKNNKLKQ